MKNGFLKNVAISAFFAELAAFLFLVLSSYLTYKSENPDGMSGFLGISALIFGSVICGVLSGILNKENAVPPALISAFIYVVIQLGMTSMFSKNSVNFLPILIKSLTVIAITLGISYIIGNKPRGHKKKHKSRR